jgi:3D (Asp-Asp-Asp) domain-containing protein
MGFPGVDTAGMRDPTGLTHQVFASTAARDAYVVTQGGVAVLQGKGYCCVVDTGAAWTFNYLTLAGLWKTAALV